MARKQAKPLLAKVAPDHPFFDIIEDAYRVFDYPTPTSTEVCDCCMYREIEADFFNPPIRELPLHYLRDWFFAAYEPSGIAKSTWAYLLPRILEVLACDEELSMNGIEVSLNRFDTGNPENWSAAQWNVLDRFQRAYLLRSAEGGEEYLDDTLCMFGIAGWSLDALFEQVAAMPDEVLVKRFWNDWCVGKPSIWIDAFWEDGGNTKAFNFYTSKPLYERFARLALSGGGDPELAKMASDVAGVIEVNADWAIPNAT